MDAGPPTPGLASWSIGKIMVPGKYRIELVINNQYSVYSDNPFDVYIDPNETGFTLISPNGEEQWPAGSKQTIKWSSINIPAEAKTVNLILRSATLSSNDVLIASPLATTNSYDWVVPNTPGMYTITVNCSAPSLGEMGCNYDTSDVAFSIVSQ
jgi:hypothetical protein